MKNSYLMPEIHILCLPDILTGSVPQPWAPDVEEWGKEG